MYKSPIEIIQKQMRTQFEDNVYKAIQDYGIVVDKDELVKALKFDRGQYELGYRDGCRCRHEGIWFSVDDILPEEDQCVLVYAKGVITTLDYDGDGRWCDEYGWNTTQGWGITHWQPLPDAPITN